METAAQQRAKWMDCWAASSPCCKDRLSPTGRKVFRRVAVELGGWVTYGHIAEAGAL
jgi:hypothetical protein